MPQGTMGELVIGGSQTMLGYLNQGVDVDCFLGHYNTGDLVVQEGDGSYTYKGRKDRQVKINGVRIAPQEI